MQYKINTYPNNIYVYISVFCVVASASLRTYCHRTRSQNIYSTHYTYKYIHANYKQSILIKLTLLCVFL